MRSTRRLCGLSCLTRRTKCESVELAQLRGTCECQSSTSSTSSPFVFLPSPCTRSCHRNQAQWPLRGSQHPREWRTETNEYLTISFLLAVLALQGAGQHSRVPLRSRVLAFCRAALDLCAEPVVDAGPSHLLLLDDDHKPPPPASRGDRIGRLLAQYDPAVRHAAFLAKPMPRDTAAFVHDPQRREYVISEHPDLPDLTHGVSDRSSLACESARGDAAPPPTVVPALAGQDMQTP